jgi:hypothetical protein
LRSIREYELLEKGGGDESVRQRLLPPMRVLTVLRFAKDRLDTGPCLAEREGENAAGLA